MDCKKPTNAVELRASIKNIGAGKPNHIYVMYGPYICNVRPFISNDLKYRAFHDPCLPMIIYDYVCMIV